MVVENSRVRLYPLNINELKEFCNGSYKISTVDFTNFNLSSSQKKAMEIKISKMNNVETDLHHWYTYWVIIDGEKSEAVGTIGFKGISEDFTAEVGYEIATFYEGKGYMTSTLSLLVSWANSTNRCKKLTATRVVINNVGSQRVLEKNGFVKVMSNTDTYNYELIL